MRERTEYVWDAGVRLFHWALVILIATALWLGYYGPPIKTWHFWTGYAIGGLIVFRLIWGFLGGRNARFANFVRGPGAVASYAGELVKPRPSYWNGHSPVAALSVIAALLLIALQVVTGLAADDEVFNQGPLANYVSADVRLQASSWHELGAYLIMAYVVLHVVMIAFYAVWKRENLVGPMITGKRKVAETETPADDSRA
jgi:cytochrome b